mmetsp:Transcript_151966/g.487801  ORF Transcript_151966/g.487801 Transcript_151966/m.487801 type:complete len:200 (+) Transcript_151966:142-741(+)
MSSVGLASRPAVSWRFGRIGTVACPFTMRCCASRRSAASRPGGPRWPSSAGCSPGSSRAWTGCSRAWHRRGSRRQRCWTPVLLASIWCASMRRATHSARRSASWRAPTTTRRISPPARRQSKLRKAPCASRLRSCAAPWSTFEARLARHSKASTTSRASSRSRSGARSVRSSTRSAHAWPRWRVCCRRQTSAPTIPSPR